MGEGESCPVGVRSQRFWEPQTTDPAVPSPVGRERVRVGLSCFSSAPLSGSHFCINSPNMKGRPMKTINRRDFLKTTALGTAAVSLPAYSWASAKGANDTIRVAVVGFGGRGGD